MSTLPPQLPVLRRGSRGEPVRNVQSVVGAKPDGVFGAMTEHLVKVWQTKKGLVADGVFGPRSWAALLADTERPTVPDLSGLPVPRFVQANRYGKGRPYGAPSLIVLHTTEGGETIRSAENLASGWTVSKQDASAHYIVDPDSVVQCVSDNDRAWHTSGKLAGRWVNDISLGIEQCGTAKQTVEQWADAASLAELELTARLIALLCARHGIPLVRLTAAELRAGVVRGITGHVDCNQASGSGDHWDPGPNYPWTFVMDRARLAAGASA